MRIGINRNHHISSSSYAIAVLKRFPGNSLAYLQCLDGIDETKSTLGRKIEHLQQTAESWVILGDASSFSAGSSAFTSASLSFSSLVSSLVSSFASSFASSSRWSLQPRLSTTKQSDSMYAEIFLKIMFVRSSGASLICGETASCLKENCNTLKWIVILNI